MSINRSAEYLVLWKSRQRAVWEATRLKEEAAAVRQQAAAGPDGPCRSPRSETTALADARTEAAEDLEAVARQLEEASRRQEELCSEIGAELDRVAAALTPDQRKDAEKVLKQWERAERDKAQND